MTAAPPATAGGLTLEGSVAPSSVIDSLSRAIDAGRPWHDALLEAVGAWSTPAEVIDGHELVYLLGGEAFDWLLLAERLLRQVADRVPEPELQRLLFEGVLPSQVSTAQFKAALGPDKYRAHLNYFYGVVVEESLWQDVERDVHKARGVKGMHHRALDDEVAERLYRGTVPALVRSFRKEQGSRSVRFTLADWKAFTYWLFKRRVGLWDSARTASDTRRGLRMLRELRGDHGPLGAAIPLSEVF